MGIWFTEVTVEDLNARSGGTLVSHLGIDYVAIGPESITARMPVDHRTVQPAGILHGGASVALAETLGSVAAFLCLDPRHKLPVGMEINANHVRPVRSGYVFGTASPIHIGNSTQLWEVRIHNEDEKLVCIARLTVAVVEVERMAR